MNALIDPDVIEALYRASGAGVPIRLMVRGVCALIGRPQDGYISNMRILLIRHGLAGKADSKAYPDDDLRPLTDKGRKSFKRAAKGLKLLGDKPETIFTSPALRARETAEILARVMGRSVKSLVDMPELHHETSPSKALARLARMKLPETAALVGHEPWLSGFLSLLIAGDDRARIRMDKGGACLVEADKLKPGGGVLIWLAGPDQLGSAA